MFRRVIIIALFASLLAILAFCGTYRPTTNPVKLRAIRSEALSLMERYPIRPPNDSVDIPASEVPPVIASLRPAYVSVSRTRVDILMKPFFDGGWGYEVPRTKQDLGMPVECLSEACPGVFWHGPC